MCVVKTRNGSGRSHSQDEVGTGMGQIVLGSADSMRQAGKVIRVCGDNSICNEARLRSRNDDEDTVTVGLMLSLYMLTGYLRKMGRLDR